MLPPHAYRDVKRTVDGRVKSSVVMLVDLLIFRRRRNEILWFPFSKLTSARRGLSDALPPFAMLEDDLQVE